MKAIPAIFVLLFVLTGCSRNIPEPSKRLETANVLAQNNSLHVKSFQTKKFAIYAQYSSLTCKDIKVYIEGDGLAWITSSIVSSDPTPMDPLALRLMAQDNATCKLYLARPCQYAKSLECVEKFWTSHRFGDDVIKSYMEVLDAVKQKYNNSSFTLVGYSGGGAIALLIAARRNDVERVITIAGNIDHQKWTDIHNISPLEGSLNPINYSKSLGNILQYHLIGKEDDVVPGEVFDSYVGNFKDRKNINHKFYDATHTRGWRESYKNFLTEMENKKE